MSTTDTNAQNLDVDTTATETNDNPNSREARYRKQLREAEAELGTLRERVTAFQRAEAERLADLEKPAALWATGIDVTDLMNETGDIDPDKVAAAAENAHEQFGASRPPRMPRPDLTQGGRMAGEHTSADSWVDAFTPEH